MGGGALWTKVVRSKYGSFYKVVKECKNGKVWTKHWSSWWRDIVKLVGCREWFWSGVGRKEGDGSSTSFWKDKWIEGGLSLSEMFPRLFNLEVVKSVLVVDMLGTGQVDSSVSWSWRQNPFAWEDDLVLKLSSLLNRYKMVNNLQDVWTWAHSKDARYSTKEGYMQLLRRSGNGNTKEWTRFIWNKWDPPKIILLFGDQFRIRFPHFRI